MLRNAVFKKRVLLLWICSSITLADIPCWKVEGKQPIRNSSARLIQLVYSSILQSRLCQMSFVCLAVSCKGLQIVSFGISLERICCDRRASWNLFFFCRKMRGFGKYWIAWSNNLQVWLWVCFLSLSYLCSTRLKASCEYYTKKSASMQSPRGDLRFNFRQDLDHRS